MANAKGPLNIAIIGAGRWGTNIIRTLSALNECRIGYVAAQHQATLEKFASFPGEKILDWRALINTTDIGAVVIATPAGSHAEVALPFIKKRLPIFIEKPLTNNLKEAQMIVSTAKRLKTPIFVGHIHLFNPAYRTLKKQRSKIGAVRLIMAEGANNGPYRDDMPALWDWAPHDLALMLDYLGEIPLRIQAWNIDLLRPKQKLHDASWMKLVFPSGAIGMISVSWLSPQKKKSLTIIGERGSIVYDDVKTEQKVTLYEQLGPKLQKRNGGISVIRQEPTVSHPEYASQSPLTNELMAFIDGVKNKKKFLSDGELGLRVIEILDAADRSSAQGGTTVTLE